MTIITFPLLYPHIFTWQECISLQLYECGFFKNPTTTLTLITISYFHDIFHVFHKFMTYILRDIHLQIFPFFRQLLPKVTSDLKSIPWWQLSTDRSQSDIIPQGDHCMTKFATLLREWRRLSTRLQSDYLPQYGLIHDFGSHFGSIMTNITRFIINDFCLQFFPRVTFIYNNLKHLVNHKLKR